MHLSIVSTCSMTCAITHSWNTNDLTLASEFKFKLCTEVCLPLLRHVATASGAAVVVTPVGAERALCVPLPLGGGGATASLLSGTLALICI